jgi:hypothetical protein
MAKALGLGSGERVGLRWRRRCGWSSGEVAYKAKGLYDGSHNLPESSRVAV